MSGSQQAVAVDDSEAVRLDTAEKRGVKPGSSVAFYNNGPNTIYVGVNDEVTTTTGAPVPSGSWGPGFDLDDEGVWAICDTGETADVRVLETGV